MLKAAAALFVSIEVGHQMHEVDGGRNSVRHGNLGMTKQKPDADVTDAVLLRRTFPPEIRKALKETVEQLDAEKSQRRATKKGSKKR